MRSLRNKVTGLKIVNQADSLTLEIYDILGQDFFGEGITAKSISEALNGSKGPVNVRINSPGGDAFEGVAIYNVLRASGRPISVSVDGLAASAASVVAMAGDSIEMGTGSMMMIHPAMMLAIGDAAEMRKAAEVLDSVTNSLADIYTQRTKNEKQQVLDWMNAETWMNPQEAMDRGFSDKMSETKAAPTAQFDLSIFKHAPEVRAEISEADPTIELMRRRVSLLREGLVCTKN